MFGSSPGGLCTPSFCKLFWCWYSLFCSAHGTTPSGALRVDETSRAHTVHCCPGSRERESATHTLHVWDDTLAKSAEAWAATCIWDHGPPYLMRFLGQNLSVRTGRYQSIVQLVKPWYDEVKDYAFPYPQDCNPRCPLRCFGPMCTHYTQMVWATTNRVGCAINTCHNMNVWGAVWRRAVFLVCNYSPKGNWIGEAPYKVGVPCSACPPSYGGSCTDNQCFPGVTSNYLYWFK
ncbi:peptidase inhibitor 15 isoform X2 [Rhinoderma darwinii]|uniref:peptidase inhibitor 15 isoform X2 n=1 Tax=Rhinoderma darwinii TaxID=43563 RepID=UPI003F667CA6